MVLEKFHIKMSRTSVGRLLKKREFRTYGINLTADRRVKKEILTLAGKLSFMRMVLLSADRKSREKLFSDFSLKSVTPLDICLGIDALPCKISIDMILRCAFCTEPILIPTRRRGNE